MYSKMWITRVMLLSVLQMRIKTQRVEVICPRAQGGLEAPPGQGSWSYDGWVSFLPHLCTCSGGAERIYEPHLGIPKVDDKTISVSGLWLPRVCFWFIPLPNCPDGGIEQLRTWALALSKMCSNSAQAWTPRWKKADLENVREWSLWHFPKLLQNTLNHILGEKSYALACFREA